LEVHHNKKADSPSGTAKTLMEWVLAAMKRKTNVLWGDPAGGTGGALPENTVHFASLRQGSVPGTHSLFFDSPADTMEITHTAHSREGFATGAIVAAEWLTRQGLPEHSAIPGQPEQKARRGIFTMDDVLKEVLHEGI
jgi:4-hydroxy-tetrahydrodipicolinate reductase